MASFLVRQFRGLKSGGIDHTVYVYLEDSNFFITVNAFDTATMTPTIAETAYDSASPLAGQEDFIDGAFITYYCGTGDYIGYKGLLFSKGVNAQFVRVEITADEDCSGGGEEPIECDATITNVSKTNETVAGANDGTITVTATSSEGGLMYSKNGGTTYQSSNIFTGLAPATYNIRIKDGNYCQATAIVQITAGATAPCDLVITGADKTDTTGGLTNGTITVHATSSGTIYYARTGNLVYQTSNVFTGLAAGNYTIFGYDTNGCSTSYATVTILDGSESCPLNLSATKTDESFTDYDDGTITASVTGNVGAVEYSLNNITWQTSPFFSGLAPSTYTVYAKDASGCTDTTSVTISAGDTPSGGCDLTIVSAYKTNTSAVGAADGQISVTATSSAFGVQYSRNNGLTWESSGFYMGFSAGSYTIKVKDASGCTAQTTLNIQNPTVSCNIAITSSSKTNESAEDANNGTITLVATSTFTGIQYSKDGGVTWQPTGVFTGLAPATYTILVKDSNNCQTSKIFTINSYSTAVKPTSTDPEVLLPNGVYSRWNAAYNPIVFGFLRPDEHIDKKGYRIEIEIISGSDTASGSWYPDLNGYVRCDVGGFVSSLVSWNVRSKKFNIRFRQCWAGFTDEWTDNEKNFYVTFSAKQLGDVYGGNMAMYLNHASSTQILARWLTRFTEPVYSVGMPFGLSYISGEELIPKNIKITVNSLDVNKAVLSTVNKDTLSSVAEIKEFLYSDIPDIEVEYLSFQVYNQTDGKFISEPIVVRVNRPCDNDPYIFLKWVNLLGGYDYYRFGYMQVRTLNVTNNTVVNRTVFNWEADNTIFDVIKKSAIKRRQFGAQDLVDLTGIESLPMSTKVLMYTSQNKYMTVELISGSFDQGTTRNRRFEVSFAVNLPEINIQRQ